MEAHLLLMCVLLTLSVDVTNDIRLISLLLVCRDKVKGREEKKAAYQGCIDRRLCVWGLAY